MSALTIELPDPVLRELKSQAEQEGVSVEAKAVALLERWVGQQTTAIDEFHAQVVIAREELERYRNTFRELSR